MSDHTQKLADSLQGQKEVFQGKENSRRRYILCKPKKKKKRNMENDEVATDYKLKQFLNDVEKFSKRSKLKHKKLPKPESSCTYQLKNEKLPKSKSSYRYQLKHKKLPKPESSCTYQGKRGLFENGILSRPSLKGTLGMKNKARLTGNLINLLNEGNKDVACPNEEGSSKASFTFEERNEFVKGPLEDKDIPEKQYESKESNRAKHPIENKEVQTELDDLIKFSEKRSSYYMSELKKTLPNAKIKSKEEFLFECQKNIMSILQKNLLERILNDKEALFGNLTHILEEYMKSKKPLMVDKCEQTMFSEEMVREEPPVAKDVSTSRNSDFFGASINQKAEPFEFHPTHGSNPEVLIPLAKRPINPPSTSFPLAFGGKVVETPREFRSRTPPNDWKRERHHISAILSPPSPGRPYHSPGAPFDWLPATKSHSSLQEFPTPIVKPHFSDFLKEQAVNALSPSLSIPSTSGVSPNDIPKFLHSSNKVFNGLPAYKDSTAQENFFNFPILNESTSRERRTNASFAGQRNKSMKTSSPFPNVFPFSKRSKLQFSPHKL